MKRLVFIFLCTMMVLPLSAQRMVLSKSEVAKLQKAQITGVDYRKTKLNFPRLVGYNSKKGPHGYGPRVNFFVLRSENLYGMGAIDVRKKVTPENLKDFQQLLVGRKLADLLDPATFLVKPQFRDVDVAIYDLVGVVLNKPFYKLFGKPASNKIACYSGMIYFDELYFEDGVCKTKEEGIKAVIDECRYDYDFGYRQFKVKIGRGKNWMSHDEGLSRDIAVIKAIHENFPDCDILVDPNNAYSVKDCIDLIEGIKPAKLYWMEEPFDENEAQYAEFDAWRKVNAPEVITIDGEFQPKRDVCMDLGRKGFLDAYCEDILDNGFTTWIELLPKLKAMGMIASPHAWGTAPKSIYAAQFGMAFGGVPTVEGVTCFSDEVELNYRIVKGYYVPSGKPGFGIRLK